MEFPNLKDSSFPNVGNVNVYQYQNDFDYARYDDVQMKVTVCAVPWDMGEAHIGARTISGIGNVVYFESKEKRDEWFANIPDNECYRFKTKYRALHRDLYIDVPLPFDVAARFNYVMVEYNLFANNDSPIQYENENGVRKWFWFAREVEYLAPNTTRLHLLDDAFQTWIYDVHITGMMLERGHAPMFSVDVDEYLADPLNNSEMLLAEDVNYGRDYISRSTHEFVFNAQNMYALFITTANISASWGTKAANTWETPGYENFQLQGVPAMYAFAIAVSSLSAFLVNVNTDYPQFVQTIKAIAFVSSDIVDVSSTYVTFASTHCYAVSAHYKTNELVKLDKESFGFKSRYSELAKLYTFPYSYLLVTDENGNQTEIRIESTHGTIDIQSSVSLVYPWLNINAHLTGIGKTGAKNITFANVTTSNMPIAGNWYDYILQWQIPTFGVIQSADTNNDYATHYDRLQAVNDYTTSQTNEYANADTTESNADLQIAANDAVTTTSNAAAQTDTDAVQSYNIATQAWQAGASRASTNNQIQAQEQSAAVAAGSNVIGSVASGAMSGGLVGAGIGLVNGIISGVTTGLQTAITTNLTETQTETQIGFSAAQLRETNQNSEDRVGIQIDAASDNNDTQNDYIEASTANTVATQKANALRNSTNAQNAINNQVKQAGIQAPREFGTFANGDTAANKPVGLFANVVTQSDSAIAQAGDEFLRYGYAYNQYWEFDGNWNIGKHYTYWKVSDFWVQGLNVPDMYMDRLRFFLFGGVTVWRKPEEIGKVSIYENQ